MWTANTVVTEQFVCLFVCFPSILMSSCCCFEICISSVHPCSLLHPVALKIHVQWQPLLLVQRALESKLWILPLYNKNTCKIGHNYMYQICGFVWGFILYLMKITPITQNFAKGREPQEIPWNSTSPFDPTTDKAWIIPTSCWISL